MNRDKSKALFTKAKQVIPGGVNSPVRAFHAVGGDPLFIKSAQGAYLFDEDGNRFIDLINSWGPMILGHAHEEIEKAVVAAVRNSTSFGAPSKAEVEIAELIVSLVPSVEKVRMVNSGTEATMSAIRLARGFTGKNKIIKFEGCYHGHGDSFLISAGSGAATMGIPNSPGVTPGVAADTLIAPYNNLDAIETLMLSNPGDIAAVIVEPVAGNMGCVSPAEGFLEGLRRLCDQHAVILIFDEVMTGFRLALGGAQELYKVTPDMTTLGKIIGGGMPVGAYGGKREIMDFVSPAGPVYQAGTLAGNPVAMAAGLTMLRLLKAQPDIYPQLNKTAKRISHGIKETAEKNKIPVGINQVGSMFTIFFTEEKSITDFTSAQKSDTRLFGHFFNRMLEKGIYLAPSQFEALFISNLITDEIAEYIVQATSEVFADLKELYQKS